jgi:hypothetical protein
MRAQFQQSRLSHVGILSNQDMLYRDFKQEEDPDINNTGMIDIVSLTHNVSFWGQKLC